MVPAAVEIAAGVAAVAADTAEVDRTVPEPVYLVAGEVTEATGQMDSGWDRIAGAVVGVAAAAGADIRPLG